MGVHYAAIKAHLGQIVFCSTLLSFCVILITIVAGRPEATAQVANTARVASASEQSSSSARFEVATIKPSSVASTSGNIRLGGHHVILENKTIEEVLELAFQVHAGEVIGGPTWLKSLHFDITGEPDFDSVPDLHQLQGMLKDLLVTRCGLALHRERREMPIYALYADEKGSKFIQTGASRQDPPLQSGEHQGED